MAFFDFIVLPEPRLICQFRRGIIQRNFMLAQKNFRRLQSGNVSSDNLPGGAMAINYGEKPV
ncbi:MAG TPA: hypothetical protein VGH42_14170 [Verrucomicrobiae bacterium]